MMLLDWWMALRLFALQHQTVTLSEAECQRRVLPLIAFTQLADAVEFRKDIMHQNNLTNL